MDFFGKWKVHDLMMFGENGLKTVTADELRAMEDNEENADFKQMSNTVIVITPTAFNVYIAVSEEQRAEVEAEGMTVNDEGLCLIETYEIVEENGEYFYSLGMMNENEPLRAKLELDENGFLIYGDGVIHLERAD